MAQEVMKEERVPIYEARQETMVSAKDGKQTSRLATFLKPCADSVDQAVNIPNTPLLSEIFCHSSTGWASEVLIRSWPKPQTKWDEWIDRLAGKYGAIWNQTNICDSILSSRCNICCNRDLILGLVEFWCSETNTFVFPWGEATITLEDVMIIGGFMVTGEPVTSPLTRELLKIKEKMETKRKKLQRTKAKKTTCGAWLKYFLEEEGELEHVAFLALWLSRYVFPLLPRETIRKEVFPLAIHLSRGKVMALAPAVLACLYRNLRLLKEQAAVSSQESIIASGPLQLLQLWAFEHFPLLGPVSPNALKLGEPRAARWHKKKSKISLPLIRSALKLQENFRWRPYADNLPNWRQLSYYKEAGDLTFDSLSSDEDLKYFLKCLVATELVGFGCREKYMPHRVAMQFGMDQDLPGDYSSLDLKNKKIEVFIARRSCEPCVSKKYSTWWKESKLVRGDAVKDILKQERSSSIIKVSPPLQEKMSDWSCKNSDSSLSLGKVNNSSVASKCDEQISVEGTRNVEVSESSEAGKNEDGDSFRLDSSSKIRKKVLPDLSGDDDDHVPILKFMKSPPTKAKRTISPEADTDKQSENVASPTLINIKKGSCSAGVSEFASVEAKEVKIDSNDDDSSSSIKKRESQDLNNNSDDVPLSERRRSLKITTKKTSNAEDGTHEQSGSENVACHNSKDSRITKKRKCSTTAGVSEVANRETKEVKKEPIDRENLSVSDDNNHHQQDSDKSKVFKASLRLENRRIKAAGGSSDDPIHIDDD